MKNRMVILVTMTVVLAVVLAGVAWFDETRQVRRHFRALEKQMTFEEKGSLMTMGLRTKRTADLFQDPCEFDTPRRFLNGPLNRETLTQLLAHFFAQTEQAELVLSEVTIILEGEGQATAEMTGGLTGRFSQNRPFVEHHRVRWSLVKEEGQWLLSELQVIESFESDGAPN